MSPSQFSARFPNRLWNPPGHPAFQAVGGGWQFDAISFVLGLVAALVAVGLLYRYRTQIGQARDRMRDKVRQLRERLTASVAARYSASTIEAAQGMHLLGSLAPLDQIYVETKLYAPLAPSEDDSVPRALDPFQVVQSNDRLLIVGQKGDGRTTLLNHLLLLQAGRLHSRGEGERVPIYAYLPALVAQLPHTSNESDEEKTVPAEPLAEAAVASMSRLEATGAARWLRGQIEAGNALILLDGWDNVPPDERPVVTTWITGLAQAYPGNHLVVVAGQRGYAPLVKADFVPLRLALWTHQQRTELARRWAKAWPRSGEDVPDLPAPASYQLTLPSPMATTIELAIRLQGQRPAATPAGQMAQLLDLLLPPPETDEEGHPAWPPQTGHRALGDLALAAVRRQQPMLDREQIQSTVTAAMPPPQFAPDAEALPKEDQKAAQEETERRTLQVVDCCRALTASGAPIQEWGDRRYHFIHPLLSDYLAARHLATLDDEGLTIALAHADDPTWFDLLRFYVGMAPAAPLIERLLSTQDDLFLNHVWAAGTLLAASPPGQEAWRNQLLMRLAQLLMNGRLPAPLRERALVALVESGEAGVGLLFKKALNTPDPALRAWAILGLGALGREQDLNLIQAALDDDDLGVRVAAIDALGRVARQGNESALELIVAMMVEAEDQAQRAAAEILAELGGEGHTVLREAAQDQDLMVRRAATYGLAAVNEPWAIALLEKIQRQDDEWLVRNAAIEALARLGIGDEQETPPPDLSLPQAETEPWLIAWAAERGEGTGTGDAALETLMRALREGDATIRQAAVETLGRLADPRTIGVLKRSLRDPEPSVRETALLALDEISHRHDMTIGVT